MKSRPPILRRGFSTLELVFAMALFAVGLLAAFGTVGRTTYAFEQSNARSAYEARLLRGLVRIQNVLESAAMATLSPDPSGALGTSDLSFAAPAELAIDAPLYGDIDRIFLRPAAGETLNGLDDDADGLIDEREVVLVHDVYGEARTEVLVEGLRGLAFGETADLVDNDGDGLVDEPGFAIQRIGESLHIHLSGQFTVRGQAVPQDVQLHGRVRLRN